ncbi:MAG: nucleotidyl transferase AbiEii/AbiGii toxin family protein [Candidatus Diapherotrites archaeon]|nr:nucleotidyl transferase AbiEii/AbiGii toxin family protein [Candidatus Diapherotrites archaeon]
MKLPLRNLLKKQAHVELASLQDEACEIMYAVCPTAVFHGGTSIWRCYSGNRFSEDLDFYAQINDSFEQNLVIETKKRGLSVSKFRKTKNNIFAKISNGRIEVSLEIAKRKKTGALLVQYEKVDGAVINVFSLSKEELIVEKAGAFLNRRLIRDIYDVYFLSSSADLTKVKNELKDFVFKAPLPVDEKNLKSLLYSGAVPSFEQMLAAIKRRSL